MIINSIHATTRGKNKLFTIFSLGKVKNILQSHHISLLIRERVQNTGPYTGFGSQVNDHVNRFDDFFSKSFSTNIGKIIIQQPEDRIIYKSGNIQLLNFFRIEGVKIIYAGNKNFFLSSQQISDKIAANKTSSAGNEVVHSTLLII